MSAEVFRKDLLFPKLSYKIIGAAYEVYNALGIGLQERTYQRAFSEALKKNGIAFKEQVYIPIKFNDKTVGSYYLDLIIEDKIICELKTGDYYRRQNIEQVISYLEASGLQLAILLHFTRNGVRQKRIIHQKNSSNSDIRTDS